MNAQKKTDRKEPELGPVTRALHKAGSSPSEVARLENVAPSTVTKVMLGQSRSARIQRRIEQIIGKPWDEIRAA
jgi:transcriptional regulator with XRE-family HTH domain